MQDRIQKLLAQAGYGSRRACEDFIIAGRVRVNGEVAKLGQKADLLFDKVTLDGNALPKAEAMTYIALYKPRNVISASEDQERQTVRDLVKVDGHLYPVGRLDYDSEGLILMTNDGDLTNKLTHPKYGHEKEYRVLLARKPDEKQLSSWRRGIVLEEGYTTQPCDVRLVSSAGKGAWVIVVMGEGRKRQIRETGRLLGLPVVKIIRMRIGTLRLGSLKPRGWRYLTDGEIAELKGETKSPSIQKFVKKPFIKKPWVKKDNDQNITDKKPWSKKEADKKPADRKPWTKRDDGQKSTDRKPWLKKDEDKKSTDRKPWTKRDDDKKSTDRKPWLKKDGDKKPADRKPFKKDVGKRRGSNKRSE